MITKSGISLAKKAGEKSQQLRLASRNIIFYHKASAGQTSINLLALSMPSEVNMTQATAQEISGAMLYVNKKNLMLVSSVRGRLMQGLDYIISSSTSIQLIGGYLSGGTLADEVFEGTISAAPLGDLAVASAQSIISDYTLAVGQTILPLGNEYKIGGAMKVFINGVLARKGEDYLEVSDGTGSGFGSTIQVLSMPVTVPYKITVDFGVRAITDTNALGTIENLSGSVKKLADDLAIVAGTTASDYYNASPSEVDRRTFGDMVLNLLSRMTAEENKTPRVATISDIKSSGTGGGTSLTNSLQTRVLNTLDDPTGIVISLSANQFTLPAGEYYIDASAPAYQSARHRARIKNITDNTVALLGTSEYTVASASVSTISSIKGRISISSSKTFELQHYTQTAAANFGLGVDTGDSTTETYSVVKITRLN